MRTLRCFSILLLICAPAMAQDGNGGLSPKAGAVSDNLYTNVYFGMNFRFPAEWDLVWSASEGACAKECMLLDVRAPGYPKVQRTLMITAEAAGGGDGRLALAGATLEQAGAKRIAPAPREVLAGGKTFYRMDYKSSLMKGELLHAILVLPGPKYALVFAFASDSRRDLEAVLENFPKQITFTTLAKQ